MAGSISGVLSKTPAVYGFGTPNPVRSPLTYISYAVSKTSGTTLATTATDGSSSRIYKGGKVFVIVAFDSLTATTPTITSVTDGTNTYTALTSITRQANTTVAMQIWQTRSTATLDSPTITVTFSNAITAKVSYAISSLNCSDTNTLITPITGTTTSLRTVTVPAFNVGDLLLVATAIEDVANNGYSHDIISDSGFEYGSFKAANGFGNKVSGNALGTSGGNRTTNITLLLTVHSLGTSSASSVTSTVITSYDGTVASNFVSQGAVFKHL